MLLIQSLLVALLTSISSHISAVYGFTGGWYTLGRPLVGGFLCGLIFGDVAQGIILGCAIQTVYLAYVTPGGAIPVEMGFVSYPSIAIALLSDMDTSLAVALASTVGAIGTIAFQLQKGANTYYNEKMKAALQTVDEKKITLYHLILPQATMILIRGIPAFLAVYFGSEYVTAFIAGLPEFVTTALLSLGGILPAVGIAALLTQVSTNKASILFFLFGFVCVVFMNINIIGLTVIAGVFAYFYYLTKAGKPQTAEAETERNDLEEVL